MKSKVRFSGRIRWELEENDLSRRLAEKRRKGETLWDLTSSNPTEVDLPFEGAAIVEALRSHEVLRYRPDPRGSFSAREAVSGYYRDRGAQVLPEDVFLTASTSEAYGFLFKLFCDPEDEVLVPRPSYPLLDFLGALDLATLVHYPLRYDGAWTIDFPALRSALSRRSRLVVAVHPNNPTGSYLSSEERRRLLELCRSHSLPLVVDEVFLDFPLSPTAREGAVESFTTGAGAATEGLVFVLSGLSKLAGLPQMKLGWIALRGEPELRREASLRLEHITDSYLSVGAPVQSAAGALFATGAVTRRYIGDRTRRNLEVLANLVEAAPSVSLLRPEGGWYAVLRVPGLMPSEEWAIRLLEEQSVYVHPGSFFGFELEALLVVSLLPPEELFQEGVRRILRAVADRIDSRDA